MLPTLLLLAAGAVAMPFHIELLLRADPDSAALGLAQSADPELAAEARAWLDLQPQRDRFHEVELRILKTGVENALIVDDLPRAAGLLASSLGATPRQPELLALRETVESGMILANPDARAKAWIELAEVCREPERRARYLERSDRSATEARYAPARRAATHAAQAGITRDAAVAMLERIDREYYIEPAWEAAAQAGARQLGWLVELGVARADEPPPVLPEPVPALDAAIAWGGGAGLASETIIAEWMHGALASLDGWTRAVWPAELASWQEETEGVRYGVGLELDRGPLGGVRVARPVLDSPAWSAGVHQGDRVLRIGELDLGDGSDALRLAEQALRGPPGSVVTLLLKRGQGEPFELSLERRGIVTETVSGFRRRDDNSMDPWLDQDDGLAYVRIDAFKPATLRDFDALTLPVADQLRGLIIDLRGNAGGDIESAVEIADRFVARGALLRISGRVLPETTGPEVDPVTGAPLPDWNEAAAGHALEGTPVVVLVDTGTASAAELLAGALQKRAGAWVVGSPTWGKGRTQALRADVEAGWAVQYTNLVWTLPDGQALARDLGGGIVPDVRVALSVGEQYVARSLAQERTAVRHHADGTPLRPEELRPRWDLPDLDRDPGILAATIVLRAALER